MNYPIDENVIIFLKSLPYEDRMAHVSQICYINNMSSVDFELALEAFGFSSEDFFKG